jgi:2-polyprenyl-3-methyl-5-hydroxy-6-metoxy-1,4-benzoquinol methylase
VSWDYYGDPRPDVQRLIEPVGRRILDVGCGRGALASALKQRGAEYIAGIELTSSAAEHARRHLDQLIEGDIRDVNLPFKAGDFDYLVFADVLEHLPDPELVLRRLLLYLAPNGRVVISVPNSRFYTVLLRLIFDRWAYTDSGVRDRTHLRIITRRSLVAMLTAEGLVVERLERNYRLIDDQSQIGRLGAIATRIARKTIAPLFFRDLMAYQYLAVAHPSTPR